MRQKKEETREDEGKRETGRVRAGAWGCGQRKKEGTRYSDSHGGS